MLAGRHREGCHGHQVQRQDQSQSEEGSSLQLEGKILLSKTGFFSHLRTVVDQKTGKTVVKYLKKRGISGDDLRREMWVHDEAETPKANRKKKGKGYDIS